jgi:hypothetical protein
MAVLAQVLDLLDIPIFTDPNLAPGDTASPLLRFAFVPLWLAIIFGVLTLPLGVFYSVFGYHLAPHVKAVLGGRPNEFEIGMVLGFCAELVALVEAIRALIVWLLPAVDGWIWGGRFAGSSSRGTRVRGGHDRCMRRHCRREGQVVKGLPSVSVKTATSMFMSNQEPAIWDRIASGNWGSNSIQFERTPLDAHHVVLGAGLFTFVFDAPPPIEMRRRDPI